MNSDELQLRRGDACLNATRALCNVCGRLVEAQVVLRQGRVFLVKWCLEHGRSEALISSDQDWYLRSLAYVKPGTVPLAHAVPDHRGCPDSCGLCPEHQQHTCVPLLEITGRCDLDCPICLVAEARQGGSWELSLEQVQGCLDGLIRAEGQINMLTLSGGEPTLHSRFLEVVDAVRCPEIGIVSVSTNGLRLSRDENLIRELRDRDVVISLQLDGFSPETQRRLRGRPELGELKRRLVERLLELGARLSLTVTLARGINEGELPGLLQLLFEHDQVVSMMVQPLAHTGRVAERLGARAEEALTLPDVVQLLAGASGGVLQQSDFSPLPCSHPTCFALTYLLKTVAGTLIPIPRLVEPGAYLDMIKNQALMGTDIDTLLRIKDALYALWCSKGTMPDRDSILQTVRKILLELNALERGAAHREVLQLGVRNIKSIFIHHFMDRATFDLSRAIKCCNHYPQPDGRLLPACVRNNLACGRPT